MRRCCIIEPNCVTASGSRLPCLIINQPEIWPRCKKKLEGDVCCEKTSLLS